MAKEKINISDAEWEVMRVVWSNNKVSSRNVQDVLNDEMNWKSATTKTLLGRLVDKGALGTETEGRRYIYHAKVAEKDCVNNTLTEVLDHVCDTRKGGYLMDILSEVEMSQSDIKRIQDLLKEKIKTAPEQIICQCIPGQCNCK